MAYAGGKEIVNSFNLELFNVAPEEERVDLYGLGLTDTATTTNYAPMDSTFSEFDAEELGGYFDITGTGGGAAQPNSNEDVLVAVVGGGGGITFSFQNDNGDTCTTATIPVLGTLTDAVDAINLVLKATAGFEGIYIGILFDFSTYTTTPTPNPTFTLYIVYSPASNYKIVQITIGNVTPPLDPQTITPKLTYFDELPCWANNYGIFIVPRNGISYGEILESQNGQVLDIKSMSFIITGSSTAYPTSQQEQIYNCFTFAKTDMNGNKIEYRKCPVVDVYSNPSINSIDDIQLERKADVYTLDGTTNMTYYMNSGIVIQIGSEYTRLTNLLQESEKGQEQIEVEKRNIAKNRLNTGYALDKVAVTEESQKNQKEFNFSGGDVKKKAPLQHYATLSLYLEGWHYSC